MKQNITLKGEVELSQVEVAQALLAQCQEDRKILLTSVTNYLKKNYGYTVKKLRSSVVGKELTVRVEVESSQSQLNNIFETEKESQPRGANSVAYKKKNKGLFTELLPYLEEVTNKGKTPVDFDEAYEAMKDTFPELTKRKFMIYTSDKRLQDSWRYVLKVSKDSEGKVISKTLNLN